MTSNLTRGGLVAAKLINLVTNEEVKFMFNPYEYAIAKQNQWEKKPIVGQNLPAVTFQQGGAQTLSLTLHFDTQKDGTDVRGHTDQLWKLMMLDTSSENSRSGKSSPPPVAFSWGRLYFKAIITSMTQKFTLFDADGTPLRCEVSVSLEQYLDASEFQAQTTDAGGTTRPSNQIVRSGDRMDTISNDSTGDPNYRPVAEQNNVDDPMRVRNGTNIRTGG